jgi:hypothetical protein
MRPTTAEKLTNWSYPGILVDMSRILETIN